MFGKAKVKRFNEETKSTPAPNAYDAKLAQTNSGASLSSKSSRFIDPKYVTPGPGQYAVPGGLGLAKSAVKLVRSASFRVKKTSLADLTTDSNNSDSFRTPAKITSSTPRRMRRSASSSDLTLSPSQTQQETVDKYKEQVQELENEIVRLKEVTERSTQPVTENDKMESLEAELETCKTELKYQTRLVEDLLEEKENLLKKCDCIAEKEDRISSLKGEVELLNVDNFNLESQVKTLHDERAQSEKKLTELNEIREELEKKYSEEDAKNGFLYFTQEQLNLQIDSLQHVVNSLRQENHLLSRGINKMVRAVQQEKLNVQAEQERIREITETYTKENADSEQEFIRLQHQLAQVNLMHEELRRENEQLKENVEVQENDMSALKDALKSLEVEKNGLALDLGVTVKNRDDVESKLTQANLKIQEVERELEDVRSEIHDLEMSKLGLEGNLACLQEELGQAEASIHVKNVHLIDKESSILDLRERESQLEELLIENKDIISKFEEMTSILKENEQNLSKRIQTKQSQIDELTALVREGCEDNALMIEKAAELSEQLKTVTGELHSHQEQVCQLKITLADKVNLLGETESVKQKLELDLIESSRKIDFLQAQLLSANQVMNEDRESRVRLEESLSNKENELAELSTRLTEIRMNREEIEESLLDTQELVECMESKLQEAYKEYKVETDKVYQELATVNNNLDDVRLERTKLVDINNDLSNQVTEGLHAIANLQERERALGSRCQEYELQMEIDREEVEQARSYTSQMEQDLTSVQSELETCLAEIGEMEVERIQLKETLNVVLEQLEDSKDELRKVNTELKESKTVGRDLLTRIQELEHQVGSMEQEMNKWKQRTCDREQEVTIIQEEVTVMHDKVSHLEQVRNNLEASLLEKSDQVQDLRTEIASVTEDLTVVSKEREEEKGKQEELTKVNLRLKGNLEQHQEQLRAARQQLLQLETDLAAHKDIESGLQQQLDTVLGRETDLKLQLETALVREKDLENEMRKVCEKETELKTRMETLKDEYMKDMDKINDNVATLENALQVQASEAADLREVVDRKDQEAKHLASDMEVKTQEVKDLKKQLINKEKEGTDLLHEMDIRMKEVKDTLEDVAKKEARILDLETDRKEKEDIRMREMDIMIDLRSQLESKENEMTELITKIDSIDNIVEKSEQDRQKILEFEDKIGELESALQKWKDKMDEADNIMKLMEAKLEEEEEKNRHLQEIIEPFKDQLESFELEKNSLLSENAQAHDEVKKLATQYGQLLGHQNQKQKIQHVVKIKQENIDLKTEINNLRKQVAKQKQAITKLEDKLNEANGVKRFDPRLSFMTPSRNKENMTPSKDTPMGPPKLGFRGRSQSSVSLGSPLRDKNY